MIFVLIALLALAVLAPVLLGLRGRVDSRGARDLAVELHRTQLRELDRDLAPVDDKPVIERYLADADAVAAKAAAVARQASGG